MLSSPILVFTYWTSIICNQSQEKKVIKALKRIRYAKAFYCVKLKLVKKGKTTHAISQSPIMTHGRHPKCLISYWPGYHSGFVTLVCLEEKCAFWLTQCVFPRQKWSASFFQTNNYCVLTAISFVYMHAWYVTHFSLLLKKVKITLCWGVHEQKITILISRLLQTLRTNYEAGSRRDSLHFLRILYMNHHCIFTQPSEESNEWTICVKVSGFLHKNDPGKNDYSRTLGLQK